MVVQCLGMSKCIRDMTRPASSSIEDSWELVLDLPMIEKYVIKFPPPGQSSFVFRDGIIRAVALFPVAQ